MVDPSIGSRGLTESGDSLIQRAVAALRGRRNGKRLRTRYIWYLLFAAILMAYIAINTRERLVDDLVRSLALAAATGAGALVLAYLATRETAGRITGNTYREYPVSTAYQAGRVLAALLVVYGLERLDPEGRIVGHPLSLAAAASFLLAVAFTLGWLIRYEKRNGPVYVMRIRREPKSAA